MSDKVRQHLNNAGFKENFQNAWLRPFSESHNTLESSRAQTLSDYYLSLSPDMSRAARYVLSSLGRGKLDVSNFQDRLGLGKMFLDIGCGFGATLVAAAGFGCDVYGIELSHQRAKCANALLKDHGLPERVRPIDVFSADFDALPKFDVILSVNVIEHVENPRLFLRRVSGLLKPGGMLFLEIPNKNSVRLVSRDPHYQLPLIVQLPHHSARALFNQHTGGRDCYGMPYGVGEYYSLSWYQSVLSDLQLRCESRLRPDAVATEEVWATSRQEIEYSVSSIDTVFSKCDDFLKEELAIVGEAYLSSISHDRDLSLPGAWQVYGESGY